MSYTPYYIADYDENGGLEQYHKPFLIPDKAFSELEDAYIYRGRVKKRDGFTHLGRLRRVLTASAIGNLDSGTTTYSIFALLGLLATEPNAQLKPGSSSESLIITVGVDTLTDASGTGSFVITNNIIPAGTIATINYATGVLTITWGGAYAATPATISGSYYPTLPVMGLQTQETNVVNEETFIAFDTKYSYEFTAGEFVELPSTAVTTWSGTDSLFFWTTNYWNNANGKLFWATNFNQTSPDPIRYYDTVTWTNFAPILAADNVLTPTKLLQARILLPYKGRLLAMNTYEGDNTTAVNWYPNRIRWSQIGTPLTIGTVGAGPAWATTGAWASDVPGYGGYIDIPTSEQIVTAEFIKDILLIKCERSSWKILVTGYPTLPFVLEKINTELGAESTFSQIPFDNGVLTVGNYGITNDDSVSVTRIDVKIPDLVFSINNDNNGTRRVYGIRDYSNELAYWTYPDSNSLSKYPNKILVYNYRNNTFSKFNDSFTCFGYYQRPTDLTWALLPYATWAEWLDTWNTGKAQSGFPDIIAGNQVGYVSVLNQEGFNGISFPISDIDTSGSPTKFTIPNHNLDVGGFVKITGVISDAGPPDIATTLNGNIYKIVSRSTTQIILQDSSGALVDLAAGGTYFGGGNITVINKINISTKVFVPYYEQGSQARLGYIDFLFDKTINGEIISNIFIDENSYDGINDPATTTGNLGTSTVLTRPENLPLIPFQQYQDKIWHRQFVQTICQNFQINMTMSDEQMFSETIDSSDFVLHAIVLYISKNARLVQ